MQDWTPNSFDILYPQVEKEDERLRLEMIKKFDINLDDLKWDMNELIELNLYKKRC